jgi:hypothetical protein
MDTTKTRSRGCFKFPKVDTASSVLMLAVGFVGICVIVVNAAAAIF